MAITTAQLADLYLAIQYKLRQIEELVGPNYKLTLLARYIGEKSLDADIMLTIDDLGKVRSAIDGLEHKIAYRAGEHLKPNGEVEREEKGE